MKPFESKTVSKAHCPQCNAAMPWSTDNPYRPFCSERCKLFDLGQWATGAYRIAQEERDIGQPGDEEP